MREDGPEVTYGTGAGGSVSDAAIDELYRHQRASLVRLAHLITGSVSVAEDIVQESFLRLRSVPGEVENRSAYMRKVVTNQARQHLRRLRVERKHLPNPPEPELPPEVDETWQMLENLTPKRRVALVLRYYEDLPFGEIARLMDCRPGTAKSLVHRGLKNLRRMLDANDD